MSIAPISRASAATASVERTSSLRVSALRPARAADVDVGRDDARALARESLGGRAADPRRRRRQERRLPRQPSRHANAPPVLIPPPLSDAPGSVCPAARILPRRGQTGIDSSAVRDAPRGAALLDGAAIAQLVEHVIRNDGVGSSKSLLRHQVQSFSVITIRYRWQSVSSVPQSVPHFDERNRPTVQALGFSGRFTGFGENTPQNQQRLCSGRTRGRSRAEGP